MMSRLPYTLIVQPHITRYYALRKEGKTAADAYAQSIGTLPDNLEVAAASEIARAIGGTRHRTKLDSRHNLTTIDVDGSLVLNKANRTKSQVFQTVIVNLVSFAAGFGVGVATFKAGLGAVKSLATLSLKQAIVRGATSYALYQYGGKMTSWALGKLFKRDVSAAVSWGQIASIAHSAYSLHHHIGDNLSGRMDDTMRLGVTKEDIARLLDKVKKK